MKKIGLAADHAGFKVKEFIKNQLLMQGKNVVDFGTNSEESVDYPDFAHALAQSIEKKEVDFGITVCGTGNGINMVANKYPFIRSALCWNTEIAKLAVTHNNANICAIPGRYLSNNEAMEIVNVFFEYEFEGGRHQKRIDKIPIKK
ncbi:MAG: ribose 5-phosphate isomerase B [Bacteroidales bacterium]